MVNDRPLVLVFSLVTLVSAGVSPLRSQDSWQAFEGSWTLGVEFSSSIQSIQTSCSGRINLMIRDGKMHGEWTVRASDPSATVPYPCDYTNGTLSGDVRDDGKVELQLFVTHRVTRDGVTTFEYVPWLRDFSQGSSCPVAADDPWLGEMLEDRLTIHGSADCTLEGRAIRATYLLRFDGSAE